MSSKSFAVVFTVSECISEGVWKYELGAAISGNANIPIYESVSEPDYPSINKSDLKGIRDYKKDSVRKKIIKRLFEKHEASLKE